MATQPNVHSNRRGSEPRRGLLQPFRPQPKALVLETNLWLAITSSEHKLKRCVCSQPCVLACTFHLLAYRVSTAQSLLPEAQLPTWYLKISL